MVIGFLCVCLLCRLICCGGVVIGLLFVMCLVWCCLLLLLFMWFGFVCVGVSNGS